MGTTTSTAEGTASCRARNPRFADTRNLRPNSVGEEQEDRPPADRPRVGVTRQRGHVQPRILRKVTKRPEQHRGPGVSRRPKVKSKKPTPGGLVRYGSCWGEIKGRTRAWIRSPAAEEGPHHPARVENARAQAPAAGGLGQARLSPSALREFITEKPDYTGRHSRARGGGRGGHPGTPREPQQATER